MTRGGDPQPNPNIATTQTSSIGMAAYRRHALLFRTLSRSRPQQGQPDPSLHCPVDCRAPPPPPPPRSPPPSPPAAKTASPGPSAAGPLNAIKVNRDELARRGRVAEEGVESLCRLTSIALCAGPAPAARRAPLYANSGRRCRRRGRGGA